MGEDFGKSLIDCHPLEEGDPVYNHIIKTNKEILVWIPASAGMTTSYYDWISNSKL